jgi:FixJ family two-component response regulator
MPQPKRPLLLVVEDDADVRDTIVSSLTEIDAEIIEKENGKHGLEAALKYKPAAILTDINMPFMTGLEMMLQLRIAGYELPIVILSAFGDRTNTVNALRLGAFDFLTKPFDYYHLNQVVSDALKMGIKLQEFEEKWIAHLKSDPTLEKEHRALLEKKKEIEKMKFTSTKKAS